MERINLFRYKKPILKISSFLTLTLALLLPVFAMRFTLDFYKRSVIDSIYNNHVRIVEKYRISRSVSLPNVLSTIDAINNQLVQTSKRLQTQIDQLENHIKTFNERTEPLGNILRTLQRNDSNWIVLREFVYADSVKISLYELYDPSSVKTADQLEKVLIDLGYKVTKSNEYDAQMTFLGKRISSVSMEGRR
ncbi:hypothetical protein AJ81_00285 [Pseudothermotoga hypogea DSM 11164 = NBRC 106472]|uniref:Uncharacterized protein n=1 Tax=Pseudothermotoga hypogea DSM 11164 = NBRC 106472 TaxID=1123384 RepID=A0A0X1KTS7_9THEM|nr:MULTISPECIES: hypothetical protein [Pseudothermotoga]AJC74606.1 hypothetical protein AJ81_00285 [Pseudothermotoga hypogea DSM 11164 = NBRC 106472]MBC7122048.1 hypothetical protein [Pseudothermotoga sp.]MDI6862885.1 hypothetical protein [Pseudothermotoga sp.]